MKEDNELNSNLKGNIIIGISMLLTTIQTPMSVMKTFISDNRKWYWVFITEALGSVKDYYII